MGYSIKRSGYTSIDVMARAMVNDLIAAGFELLYPAAVSQTARAYTLKAGANVDPLQATQPWAIKLQWDKGVDEVVPLGGGILDIVVATPTQFTATSQAKYERFYGQPLPAGATNNRFGVSLDTVGVIGTAVARDRFVNINEMVPKSFGYGDRTFIDRTRFLGANEPLSYPMSYQLSVSDRGFALFAWEEGHDREANRYSWVVVQRPVDNKTGQAYITGKAPVHCLYGLNTARDEPAPWNENGTYNIRRFVVREADINVPYPLAPSRTTWFLNNTLEDLMGVPAIEHTVDYNMVMNATQQVAISEGNKYILTFPNGFNTARYAYAHELDMIAYTSADVVSEGTVVPVQVYGETNPRKYLALNANGPNNTGMRLLALIDGGGVTPHSDSPST